jgi:hypothetical protein
VSISRGATPDPIPNSEVKSSCGDGIARASVWESSTMPALIFDDITGLMNFDSQRSLSLKVFLLDVFISEYRFGDISSPP